MKDGDKYATGQRRRATSCQQPLVVRHTGQDLQPDEVLERLARVEASLESPRDALTRSGERGQFTKLDAKTIIALGAIFLSIAGYVIEDARNTSRQDAEIETTKVRLTNLEKIASANTEARIRTEVQLGELREGQTEIKQLLRAHDDETIRFLRKKNAR